MTVTVTSALAGPATARYSNVYGALVDLGVLSGLGAQDVTGSGDPVAPILNASLFYAPLKSTLALTRGTGSPTYTRATNAWEMDNEGKLILVPSGAARFGGARMVRNLLTYTEDFSNAAWNVSGSASKAGETINCTAIYDALVQTITVNAVAGSVYTASFWLTGSGVVSIKLLENTGSYSATTGTAVTLSATPQLVSVTKTITQSLVPTVKVYIQNNVASTCSFTGYGQLENVTGQADQTASEYVSVGVLSAPYHGAGVDGVKWFNTNKDGSAIPASSLLGNHTEGARTNSLLWARDLTNAAWAKTNITAAKTATGIDNAPNSASTLTADAADATILQTLSLAAAGRSFSAYVTRRTGVGPIYTTRDGFATEVDISGSLQVGSLADSTKRYRVKIENSSVLNPQVGFKIATSGDAIDVDVCQDEAGAFISSPIITTTAAVTRNGDDIYYPSANISNATGSVLFSAMIEPTTSGARMLIACGTASVRRSSGAATTTINFYDGTNDIHKTGLTDMSNGSRKRAFSYTGASASITGDGNIAATGSFDGSFGANNALRIGNNGDGVSMAYGYIRNVYTWNTALTDAQLQQVTA